MSNTPQVQAAYTQCVIGIRDTFSKCMSAANGDTTAEKVCSDAFDVGRAACAKSTGYAGQINLPAQPADPCKCSECAVGNIPACVSCMTCELTRGLKSIGINIVIGAVLLLGVFLLVKPYGEKAAKLVGTAAMVAAV